MYGKIIGSGAYVPPKIVTNSDLCQRIASDENWIFERTGIHSRHIAEEDTTVTMAVKAARQALERAKVKPEEVDAILVSTTSPNVLLPSVAASVQGELQAVHAFAMDVNSACAGFLYAFHMVQSLIKTGSIKTALVIGSECLSQIVDWDDRGTCILFGDGAGAVCVKASEEGWYDGVLFSDGSKREALTCESRHQKNYEQAIQEGRTSVRMDGRAIFKFALRKVPEAIEELLEKTKLSVDEVDYILLHQANVRILEGITKRIQVASEKVPQNMEDTGNVSSACIPMLIHKMMTEQAIKDGQLVVMAGFGAGLSWGAAILSW